MPLLFLVLVAMGVTAKLWRAVGLWVESDATDGFVWLPLGVGSELLFAGMVALVVGGAWRLKPAAGGVVAGLLTAGSIAWFTLNDISYRVSQIGITWWRLRGDEGLRLRDFDLVSIGDVFPALALTLVCIGFVGLAVALDRRVDNALLSAKRLALLTLAGLAVHAVDMTTFNDRNFGMAENPALLLGRTWLETVVGEGRQTVARTLKEPRTREERMALLRPEEPQPPPETTGTPSRAAPTVKNAVVFFSEGIARKHTGLAGLETTPNLMKAVDRWGALEFEHYYTTYHKSIAAIFSMTCADFPPPNAKNIMEVNPRIDCGSTPEIMAKNGVHPGLFHGGDFGFYDKLQLLGMRGYETQKDARSLDLGNAWDYDWGIDDRVVVDAILAWIDTIPADERFFVTYIPITAHYPYAIPPDVEPAFPGSNGHDRFKSAVHFLDQVYGRLIDGLVARGRMDDTAVIYMADHGETVAERPRAQAGRRLAYEPSLNVPMAIVAPSMFKTHQKSRRVGSHVDLLPTVMDLMGLPKDERHVGQSLVGADFEPRRIFIGASNGPKYVGFVDGRTKFVVGRSSGFRELYDLETDPFETKNLAEAFPDKVDRYTGQAIAFADGQLHWLNNAPKLPDTVDVQAGLLEHAAVRIVKQDGTKVACERPADSLGDNAVIDVSGFDALPFRRQCGAEPPVFLGARTWNVGRTRDCVLVNVPEGGGAVEIVLNDQPWQPFLTRIRAAAPKKLLDSDDEAILTAFGDGLQGQEKPINTSKSAVRVTYPSSSHELIIRVSGERRLQAPLCLTFTEAAWRKIVPRRSATIAADPPADDATQPTTLPDDDDPVRPTQDDDTHGRRPRPDE